MKDPGINWRQPLFTAWLLTVAFVTAYGGLRGHHLPGILKSLTFSFLAWTDWYTTRAREKALPKESYLV